MINKNNSNQNNDNTDDIRMKAYLKKTKLTFLFFFSYLICLFVFGGIYYYIYINDNNSFAFIKLYSNERIFSLQNDLDNLIKDTININNKIKSLENYILEINEIKIINFQSNAIKNNLDLFPLNRKKNYNKITSIDTIQLLNKMNDVNGFITIRYLPHAMRSSRNRVELYIYPENILEFSHSFDEDNTNLLLSFKYAIENEVEVLKSSIIENASRIKKIRKDIKNNTIYNYFDFVYFSFITITTIGYSDIIPNSTNVRVVIFIEVILGIFITVFLINSYYNKNNH